MSDATRANRSRTAAVLRFLGIVAVTSTLPGPAVATSLLPCFYESRAGLEAPWSSTTTAQPDANTTWRVIRGEVLRIDTNGETRSRPSESRLHALSFVDARTGWAVGDHGTVVHTSDGGANWIVQISGTNEDLHAVSCTSRQACIAAGEAGTVLVTADGGFHWSRSVPETIANQDPDVRSEVYEHVAFADLDHAFIVGDTGEGRATTDGGKTWQRRSFAADPTAVHFVSAQRGWLGAGSRIMRTVDGGHSWEVTLELPRGLGVWAFASNGGERVVAAARGGCTPYGDDVASYASTDGGNTWTELTEGDSEIDWNVELRGERAGTLRRVLVTPTRWSERPLPDVIEVAPTARGVVERHVRVSRHEGETGWPCPGVEIESGETIHPFTLRAWSQGLDMCLLDPSKVAHVLGRLSTGPEVVARVAARCDDVWRAFEIPRVHRQPIRRNSPAIDRLIEMTQPHVPQPPLAEAPPAVVRELRAGAYDAAFADPHLLHTELAAYQDPNEPGPRVTVRWEDARPLVDAPVAYPPIARAARVEGGFRLQLDVDPVTGCVRETSFQPKIPLLSWAVENAAASWRFRPGTAGPILADVTFEVCGVPDGSVSTPMRRDDDLAR